MGFLTDCTTVLRQVFCPLTMPQKAGIYIVTNNGDTGLIGKDCRYQFSKHLTTLTGVPIAPQKDDFYVPVQTLPTKQKCLILRIVEVILKKIFFFLQPKQKAPIAFNYMPSTLFKGKKEGEKVTYYLDGQSIELTLQQSNHPQVLPTGDFEANFEGLLCWNRGKQAQSDSFIYLFREDMPDHLLWLGNRIVSEKAMVYVPGTNERKEVSQEILRDFNSCGNARLLSSIKEGAVVKIWFDCPGVTKDCIQVLIDKNYMSVLGKKELPKGEIKFNNRDFYISFDVECSSYDFDRQSFIQLETVKVEVDDGIGYLEFAVDLPGYTAVGMKL